MKLVSVIMPVYNAADTLVDAIESIVNQTYTNWELIMIDDGSKDQSYKIMEEYKKKYPEKIVLLKNEHNLGLNLSLNKAIKKISGKYVARMDSDDMSVNTRFEKLVAFLDSHDDTYFVSTPMIHFSDKETWRTGSYVKEPTKDHILSGSPICHAPVMLRREQLESVGGYSTKWWTTRVEDVNLWIELYSNGYKCFNLEEPLYMVRDDLNAFSRRKYRYRINSTIVRLRGCLILKARPLTYIKSFIPMIIGLVPNRLRFIIKNKMGVGIKRR